MATEQLEGYELTTGQDGLAGTRIFQGTSASGLPSLGDPWPGFGTGGQVVFTCRTITQRSIGKTQGGSVLYEWTCQYNTQARDGDNGDDDEAPRRIEFGVTGHTMKENTLYWGADDPITDTAVPVFTPTMEIVITRNKSSFPSDEVAGKIGLVNEGTFEGLAAGTVMFTGGSAQEITNSSGTKKWRIELRFSYNPNGWNTALRPGVDQYQSVYRTNGTTDTLYDTGSLGSLL